MNPCKPHWSEVYLWVLVERFGCSTRRFPFGSALGRRCNFECERLRRVYQSLISSGDMSKKPWPTRMRGTMASMKPEAIKSRLRTGRVRAQWAVSRDIAACYGKPIEEWDEDELDRGKIHHPNGSFSSGKSPAWIWPLVDAERQRRSEAANQESEND